MLKIEDTPAYIATFPDITQKLLKEIRSIIKKAAPAATEKIAYGIPTFCLHGNLVHFGGAKKHIGFYPGAGAINEFKNELKDFNTSKGTIQFPLDKPLPATLITAIVKYRISQNEQKAVKKIKKPL